MQVCPACGERNAERSRFCSACGTRLAVAPGSEEVRKTVTVVFSDVVGSTALAERLDPEAIRQLMRRYFDVARSALEHHGATIEKFIGDAVMAVFGIPQSHEDDALRAVRAAAEMCTKLEDIANPVDANGKIELRVGINTGEVVASATRRDSLVTGDAVNVAARLQQAAGPGEILISDATYHLVRHAVEVSPVADSSVKGRRAPVTAWRVLSAATGAVSRPHYFGTSLVGRKQEMEELARCFEAVTRSGRCQVCTVVGAPGVGKSRLVEEALARLPHDVSVFSGRCLPYGQGITYWPLVEIIRTAAGIDESDAPAVAYEKVRALCEPAGKGVTERVASTVGLSDSAWDKDETFWAFRKLFEHLSSDRPVALAFDDLHWAEGIFLELIDYLGDSPHLPVMIVGTARPEFLEVDRTWHRDAYNKFQIVLQELSYEESCKLVESFLGSVQLSEDVSHRLVEKGQGNPLFVEEMLRMLIDRRFLRKDNGHWVFSGDVTELDIPATIESILSARLDMLTASERWLLSCAAVSGEQFSPETVRELGEQELAGDAGIVLDSLLHKEFFRQPPLERDDENLCFAHILLRDVAYAAIPKRTRARLHEQLATHYEQTASRIVEYEEIIAYHLEQACHYRWEIGITRDHTRDLAKRASEHLTAAARRSSARVEPSAPGLWERAVALLDHDDRDRLKLLPELGFALLGEGDGGRAETIFKEAATAATTPQDVDVVMHARVGLAEINFAPERGLAEAKEAIELFEASGDHAGLTRAWRLRAFTYGSKCDPRAWLQALEQACHHARLAGWSRAEAGYVATLAQYGIWTSMPITDAIPYAEGLLERVTGYKLEEAKVLAYIATFHAFREEFDEARQLMVESRRRLDELGEESTLTYFSRQPPYIAMTYLLADDPISAERELRHGLELLEPVVRGREPLMARMAAFLAMTLYLRGEYVETARLVQVARQYEHGDCAPRFLRRAVQAKLLARAGEFQRAERLARSAVAVTDGTDLISQRADLLLDLAEVLDMAGRRNEARDPRREALALYEKKGNLVGAKRARAALADAGA